MAETPCFFGLTTARVGARVVAYLQFWSQLLFVTILMFKCLNEWIDTDENATAANKNATAGTANATAANETAQTSTSINYYTELDFYNSIFSQLSASLLIIYASYYLKIATYTHNLMHINFWMIINCVNFITTVALIIFASIGIGRFTIFLTGVIGCMIKGYKIYVVYLFYMDETSTDAVNDGQNPPSNGDRSLPQNHVAVEIRTESIGTNNHRHPTLDEKNITQNFA